VSDDLWSLREVLGTAPSAQPVPSTKFYRGVEGIEVTLIDWPTRPYRALFNMVTSTWGNVWATNKWENASPEARLHVVNAVLARKTLPNAMEGLNFTFEIAGPSRSAFDQIARARIGAVFSSMGWRDNNHADIGFRVPEGIWRDSDRLSRFKHLCRHAKDAYILDLETGQSNWQDARALLPISACHRWTMSINFMALTGFMARRLMFSEQADTVATAWLMRQAMFEQFPLLATWLRPASDHARKCLEHGEGLGAQFHNLFRCSGRWPCDQAGEDFTFNESCSDRQTMMEQTGLYIPRGDEWLPGPGVALEVLWTKERERFEAEE